MVVPTALPAEPIDLEQSIHSSKKRRNSELTHTRREKGATVESHTDTATNGVPLAEGVEASPQPDLDDLEDDADAEPLDIDDNHSAFEDILDQVEAFPYEPSSDVNMGRSMKKEEIIRLRQELRQNGIEKFFEDTIDQGMDVRTLGIAFGLDPELEIEDETFLRLLGLAAVRAFYKREKLSEYNTLEDAAALLQKSKKILVITGAGISTSLGIPDFRSKGTGFYDKIQQMGRDDISEPQDVFDIHIFDSDPTLFYELAGEILPDRSKGYTPTHGFIQLLDRLGKLQTNYTQNIDNLEGLAGINPEKVIQCHGSFKTATCRKCKHKVDGSEIEADIRSKRVPTCKRCIKDLHEPKPKKSSKGRYASADSDDDDIPEPGVMKPDITFFHEQLPENFFTRFTDIDSKETDLVIVIGTSLKVAPVSEMPNYLPHSVPHIYISMEPIRHVEFDIQLVGKCDDIVAALCKEAGWTLDHSWINPDMNFEATNDETGHPYVWAVRPLTQSSANTAKEDEDVGKLGHKATALVDRAKCADNASVKGTIDDQDGPQHQNVIDLTEEPSC